MIRLALLLLLAACGARSGLLDADAAAPTTDEIRDAAPDVPDVPVPPCDDDRDCDDDLFCTGEERCVDGACAIGDPVDCASADPCRVGRCVEDLDVCQFVDLDLDLDLHLPLGCGDDCDDSRPEVHPGAKEICDYLDDDCDGEIDEGLAYEGIGTTLDLTTGWTNGRSPDLRFDGDFDVVLDTWPDTVSQVFYVSVTADGTRSTAPAQRTFSTVLSTRGDLEWNGTEYALFSHYHLLDVRDAGAIALTRLDANGVLQVDAVDMTDDDPDADLPSASWSGADYGVAYVRNEVDGTHPIHFVRVDADGAALGTDWVLSSADRIAIAPSVAWTGAGFAVATVEDATLFVSLVDADGESSVWTTEVGAAGLWAPSLVWTGTAIAVAWSTADGELRLVEIDERGGLGTPLDLGGREVGGVDLVWTGREYAISHQEIGRGDDTWITRVGSALAWSSPAGEVDVESRDDASTALDSNGTQYGVAFTAGRVDSGWVGFRLAGCP